MVEDCTYEQYKAACVSINEKACWTRGGWLGLVKDARIAVMANLLNAGAWWPDRELGEGEDVPETEVTPW
jgi:hypothetical protein